MILSNTVLLEVIGLKEKHEVHKFTKQLSKFAKQISEKHIKLFVLAHEFKTYLILNAESTGSTSTSTSTHTKEFLEIKIQLQTYFPNRKLQEYNTTTEYSPI